MCEHLRATSKKHTRRRKEHLFWVVGEGNEVIAFVGCEEIFHNEHRRIQEAQPQAGVLEVHL